jgi:hypothetical protein
MKKPRYLALVIIGLTLPLALVAATYLISSRSLNAPVATVRISTDRIARPKPSPSPSPDRRSGRCDEAEHRNDPECNGTGGGSDRSSDDSGSEGNSGRGRDHPEDD